MEEPVLAVPVPVEGGRVGGVVEVGAGVSVISLDVERGIALVVAVDSGIVEPTSSGDGGVLGMLSSRIVGGGLALEGRRIAGVEISSGTAALCDPGKTALSAVFRST